MRPGDSPPARVRGTCWKPPVASVERNLEKRRRKDCVSSGWAEVWGDAPQAHGSVCSNARFLVHLHAQGGGPMHSTRQTQKPGEEGMIEATTTARHRVNKGTPHACRRANALLTWLSSSLVCNLGAKWSMALTVCVQGYNTWGQTRATRATRRKRAPSAARGQLHLLSHRRHSVQEPLRDMGKDVIGDHCSTAWRTARHTVGKAARAAGSHARAPLLSKNSAKSPSFLSSVMRVARSGEANS